MASKRNFAAALGDWSANHRKTAIFGWLIMVVLVTVLGGAAGQQTMTEADYGTGDSGKAERILQEHDLAPPAEELILVHSDELTATDPEFRSTVDSAVAAIKKTDLVTAVQNPNTTKVVSKDKHSALIQYEVKGDPETASERIQPVIDAVKDTEESADGVTLGQYGAATGLKAINDSLGEDLLRAEMTALPVSLGILLVVFGALVAALLPLLLAVTACVAAMGLLAVSSQFVPVDGMTTSVMFLMGLAVGVDYCLFYLRREREERTAGRDKKTALHIAAATSGHSVLVSGITVVVAMAGMFLSGLTVFEGFAMATIEVVLIAVLGSMTVLPAAMAALGDRVQKGRIPFVSKRRDAAVAAGTPQQSNKLLRGVLARPALFAVVGSAMLLALAAPALGMKTEKLGTDELLPPDDPMVSVAQQIGDEFPGTPSPAGVVIESDDIKSPEVTQAIAAFKKEALASGHAQKPIQTKVHDSENVAEISVPLAGNGSDAKSKDALEALRGEIIPKAFDPTGDTVLVRGELAFSEDYSDALSGSIVPVFAFVMGVTFLLMLFTFRSPVIALTAIVLNLMSVGAAYGVMAAVFQHGWGDALVGTEAPGAVESWMPLFVFVVLFGLSMDYHVFVVSRIREAHDQGVSTRDAIEHGIRSTAGVVTSAGLIMVAVFAVFGTLAMQDFKQLGVGLAVAVLLDCTVVRAMLLPSVMALLGEANWKPRRFQAPVEPPQGAYGEPAPSLQTQAFQPAPGVAPQASQQPEATVRLRGAQLPGQGQPGQQPQPVGQPQGAGQPQPTGQQPPARVDNDNTMIIVDPSRNDDLFRR
ncbi:MMPL family transporter [Streptomyces armeniacus]|uniref:MMPL family transporter n=1 Tax=Streptomyces armeniacus TaxID=83291 RepID=A0A345XPT6_9ACTN|nr:MMPL family transporter [Streptomyces armeniacus]AXK33652.1 MMPL family transporter [Streptomyces armeniacus]